MIYLLVIFLIIILWFLTRANNRMRQNNDRFFMLSTFVLVFLLCALRATSVGRDIPGYERVYDGETELVAKTFFDFSYTQFEKGFVLLMQFFKFTLHASFQVFLAFCYFIILFPVWAFISKHSSNKCISIVTFICYIYFEFYLTGIRQAMAMSIILMALIVLLSDLRHRILLFYIITTIAFFFHQSAILCVFIPIIKKFKKPEIYSIVSLFVLAVLIVFRTQLSSVFSMVFNRSIGNGTIYFGLNSIVLVVISIICVYLNKSKSIIHPNANQAVLKKEEAFLIELVVTGVVLSIFFGTSTLARSYMYYGVAIILLIPNISNYFDASSKKIYLVVCCIFLIGYFSYSIFTQNNFDILPYKFFWQ